MNILNKIKNIKIWFHLRCLTKLINSDKDNIVTIIFLGNDEVQICESGKTPQNYQFK